MEIINKIKKYEELGLWEEEFYNVYINSTPTTDFIMILESVISNLEYKEKSLARNLK